MLTKALLFSCTSIASIFMISSSSRAECGDVTIASMNWQSAEVLANVDKIILESGYGCNVEIIVGETVSSLTSMVERQKPDIMPEAWLNALPEVITKGIDDKSLITTGQVLSDGGIHGWYIPKYIADGYPNIKKVSDALKHPELFPAPENNNKGAVVNGPPGWAVALVTSQLYTAYDGDNKGFLLIDPGSTAALDGSIAKNYERKIGWLGYYWSPTSLLGKYDMVKLDFDVPYDEAEWKRCTTMVTCKDPKLNAWPADKVISLVTSSFAKRSGMTLDYLTARQWSNDTLNLLLSWMTENQATGEGAAKHFLENNPEIWMKWLKPGIAEKVKASL